jgi:hypothetical protein
MGREARRPRAFAALGTPPKPGPRSAQGRSTQAPSTQARSAQVRLAGPGGVREQAASVLGVQGTDQLLGPAARLAHRRQNEAWLRSAGHRSAGRRPAQQGSWAGRGTDPGGSDRNWGPRTGYFLFTVPIGCARSRLDDWRWSRREGNGPGSGPDPGDLEQVPGPRTGSGGLGQGPGGSDRKWGPRTGYFLFTVPIGCARSRLDDRRWSRREGTGRAADLIRGTSNRFRGLGQVAGASDRLRGP